MRYYWKNSSEKQWDFQFSKSIQFSQPIRSSLWRSGDLWTECSILKKNTEGGRERCMWTKFKRNQNISLPDIYCKLRTYLMYIFMQSNSPWTLTKDYMHQANVVNVIYSSSDLEIINIKRRQNLLFVKRYASVIAILRRIESRVTLAICSIM